MSITRFVFGEQICNSELGLESSPRSNIFMSLINKNMNRIFAIILQSLILKYLPNYDILMLSYLVYTTIWHHNSITSILVFIETARYN